MPSRPDIGRFDVAVVDAEIEHERDFSDEKQAEEEGKPAQRFLAAFFKRHVIDLIDAGAEHVKRRRRDDGGENRIDAQRAIDDIGDVRAENDEGGMRDVDDVENAERQRYARRDGGVEAADQDAGNDGIDEQIERKNHYSATQPQMSVQEAPRLGYNTSPAPGERPFRASVLKPRRGPYRVWRAAYWRCRRTRWS